MATIDFSSLVRGYVGEGWPELRKEQAEFLASQPKNKKGWHYFQMFAGPTIHFKSGVDYRNPSVPYQVVKVNGTEVISRFGHDATHHEIVVSEKKGRIRAYKEGKFQYMPENWVPRFDAWDFYKRFFYPHSLGTMDRIEGITLWAANLDEREKYAKESIEGREQTIRNVANGLGGSITLDSALHDLEVAICEYVCYLQGVRNQVEECLSVYRGR